MTQKNNPSKRENIEFIRFFFAAGIVYFHLLHSFIMPYTEGTPIYETLADQAKYAKYIVECFFIISGYFLFQSIRRRPDQPTGVFILKKIFRLWPVLAVSTILSVILLDEPIANAVVNLFFLQSTTLATVWSGLNWYVSAFFVAEIFYFMLYKAMKNSQGMKLLIVILVYFGYSLNLMHTDGGFVRSIVYDVFSLAVARAIAGVGLGYLIGWGYHYIEDALRKLDRDPFRKRVADAGISILEVLSFACLLMDFFNGSHAPKNQFLVVIFFTIFFLCMLTGRGAFSRLASRTPFCRLGKYAYSIYVMQTIAFYIMKKTLWKQTALLIGYPAAVLFLSVLTAVLLGVIIYWLIERPAARLSSRYFK